ncbi:VWA domain-containing protein [Mycobacterium hodleri]|uniref:VWA domain-containing protein n=1 Tax=Mycolicibacterium hodleri TaxID=49897 RepID=UPI0021F39EA2|nr:VWA domain-containing protein [Mycolicibacterium hodleri]MCV7135501.1 VWA domain-containing protein [Mycolicibacterium hodleri]
MTLQPVFPPLLLAAVAVIILVARVVALRRLSPAARTRGALWRWGGLTAAALLLVVSAARPVLDPADPDTRVADSQAPNVFVLVDRSPDMDVRDEPDGASRMTAARTDVAALLDRYPDARVAVISFASRASLDWPLSADTWSLRPVVSTLTPYAAGPDAAAETNAGAAGNMLRYQLISAVQQYPRARNLVYYLGAGAPEAALPPRDFNLPEGAVDGGAVLGYGSPVGGPIPGTDVTQSVVDEATLRGVADQIGVPYALRGDGNGLASVLPAEPGDRGQAATGSGTASRTELYWAPAAVAALLALIELYHVLREFRRTRQTMVDVSI